MTLHQTTASYLRDGKAHAENAAVDVTHEGVEILWIPEAPPASYTADSLAALAAMFATAAVEKRRIELLLDDAEQVTIAAVYQ